MHQHEEVAVSQKLVQHMMERITQLETTIFKLVAAPSKCTH